MDDFNAYVSEISSLTRKIFSNLLMNLSIQLISVNYYMAPIPPQIIHILFKNIWEPYQIRS